ncbi:MAG: DMT family transporter, partial [Proteobacteria bacterium]|nr:DMT family transporter [Pseudomonadota bacterium]
MTTGDESIRRAGHIRGIAYLLVAIAFLGCMEVGVKILTETLSVGQILWARFAFHLIGALPILLYLGIRSVAKTDRPVLQIVRSLLQLLATLGIFLAIERAPLAEAITIHYLSPLIVTALSVPLLGERVSLGRWFAVSLGFLGVLVILRPGLGGAHWGASFALISAVSYALFQVTTRMLGFTDRPGTTMFYTPVVGAVVASLIVPFVWITPSSREWLLLIGLGLSAGIAHFMLIKAFQSAEASGLQPYNYAHIIWASILGFLFFGSVPEFWTLLGAALIVSGGLWVFYGDARS